MDKIRLEQQVAGRKIWFWGAKITGRSACAYIRRCAIGEAAGFIDSDPVRQAKPVKGLTVLSPEAFFASHTPADSYLIIAARQWEDEIMASCAGHGFAAGRDMVSAFDILGPIYELDVIRLCNLKCPSCPQGNCPGAPFTETMTVERFEKILAHILAITPNVAHIGLYSWGEPFLHKQLDVFIEMVNDAGIPCFLSSNFSHEISIEPALRAGVDFFRVSISGYSQSIYQIDHAGGNINLVKSNMYKLRYLIDKYELDTSVEVVYHKYDYNLEELPKVEALCQDLGFTLATYVASILPNENMIRLCEGGDVSNVQPVIDRLLFDIHKLPRRDMRGHEEECFAFFNSIGLTPTGQVIVCHNAYDLEQSCLAEDFLEMESYEAIIKAKYTNPTCQKCRKYGVFQMFGAIIDDAGKFTHYHRDDVEE